MEAQIKLRVLKVLALLISLYFLLTIQGWSALVDRIAAIVGDKVITQSEVDEASLLLANLANIDKGQILDQLIERELLLVEAQRETLVVEEDELQDAVEKALLEVRGRFPSDEAYEDELMRAGLTEEELRLKYSKEMEQKLLIQKLIQKKFGKELGVSDIEVINFYNTHIESIPIMPDAIRFLGVVVYYVISDSAESLAKIKAEKILARIKMGKETFEELAEKYSDDPISKKNKGKLGSINLRDLGKEFQPIVSNMIAGEVAIVPSIDAYHIVKCNERHGEFLNLSNIVIKITPTRADSQATQQMVDSVRLVFEKIDIDTIHPRIEVPNTMIISWGEHFVSVSATPFTSFEAIEVGKVYTFNTPHGIQVIKPIAKRAAYLPEWHEIRDELKNLVYQRKLQARYQRLINKLKEEVFVKKML